jgi:hypothetical protein
MSLFTEDEKEMLLVWSESGERPFEVIKEMGKEDEFLYFVSKYKVLARSFYRGTLRHGELQVGDILDYTYPTSWSLSKDSAMNFIEESGEGVLLVVIEGTYCGVENTSSYYKNEREVILAPAKFIVIERSVTNGVVTLILK